MLTLQLGSQSQNVTEYVHICTAYGIIAHPRGSLHIFLKNYKLFQSDVLLQTQMGTKSNTASEISDLLTGTPNSNIGSISSSTPISQNIGGGRVTQDRESDEASRSRESNGQRSSVYIGQVI